MSNIPIREMAQTGTPSGASLIVFDDGSMKKGTVSSLADAVRPVASQSEAQAGADNAKTMTPLRVKDSIAAEVGVSIASKSQGDLANTALQPRVPIIVSADGPISAGVGAVAIQKSAPTTSNFTVPSVDDQKIPLSIFDWSTSIAEHAITLTAAAGETIMRQPSITIYSTPSQMAGITLYPSTSLDGWYIAP